MSKENIANTVFISYRRDDISSALLVYKYLTDHKYDVFFDSTSISGGDFEQIIIRNIRARAHFIVILTPTALQKCNEPNDWLRREIETAIDEKRNIIPLFFSDFSFRSPGVAANLTGKLETLKHYNGLAVPNGYFDEAMAKLTSQFLNVSLDTVIHPISPEVQIKVEKEQNAANKAIKEKNLSSYKLGIGVLLVIVLGIAGLNIWMKSRAANTPIVTGTSQATTQIVPTRTAAPPPTIDSRNTEISQQDGMTLLYVPAGEFRMGSENGKRDERPVHTINLDAFWMDQTEVTNGMYAKCVEDGVCIPPESKESHTRSNYYGNPEFDSYPVIFVDWNMAKAYCEWAGRRLPTEAEWEKAARGDDQRMYPWGNETPTNDLVNYNGAVEDTTRVGTYPKGASPYGVMDMAGNVWEWVADFYDSGYYYKSDPVNPQGPTRASIKNDRVLRGGSWNGTSDLIYSSLRRGYEPTHTDYYLGFRCARAP